MSGQFPRFGAGTPGLSVLVGAGTTDVAETAVPLPEQQGRSDTPEGSERVGAMTSPEAGRVTGRPAASREPLGRAERLHLAVLGGVFVLPAAVFGAGAAAYTAVTGQMLGLQERMGGIHEEIGRVRAELHEEIGGLRGGNARGDRQAL